MPRPRDWYPDTDPKALEVFIELQRKMTPAEKIEAVFQMNESVRRIRETRERKLHPRASDREIFLRVASHYLDRGTMLRIYGWYPPVDSDLRGSTMIAEKRFVVHYTSGETEIVHALQAIQDDEPEGYLGLVDSEGVIKALFHKPIVDRWEESAAA
ncbi:MAG TPA: hypothetical protein VNV82_24715 [Bryobacteraceae bacterium]|jgi:hypothetical protein|nr:hypothetical protein [Bryobacteraceae bacterium]